MAEKGKISLENQNEILNRIFIKVIDAAEILRSKGINLDDDPENEVSYVGDERYDRLMTFSGKLGECITQKNPELLANEILAYDKKIIELNPELKPMFNAESAKQAAGEIISADLIIQRKSAIELMHKFQKAENGPYDADTLLVIEGLKAEESDNKTKNSTGNVEREQTREIGRGSANPHRGLICRHSAPELAAMVANAGFKDIKVLTCKVGGGGMHVVALDDIAVLESTHEDSKQIYRPIAYGNIEDLVANKKIMLFVTPEGGAGFVTSFRDNFTEEEKQVMDRTNKLLGDKPKIQGHYQHLLDKAQQEQADNGENKATSASNLPVNNSVSVQAPYRAQ